MTDEVFPVLRHWRLEPIVSVQRATSGAMNEIFIVSTEDRTVVLRKHRRPDRAQVAFEHAVITYAADHGIATPRPIPTPGGETIVDHDGSFHSLFACAIGEQIDQDELTPEHAAAMGARLAGLHVTLAPYPIERSVPTPAAVDPELITDRINNLLSRIDRIEQPSEQDAWAADHLKTKRAWLAGHPVPVWRPVQEDRLQLVHGDYLHTNLFFTGAEVSSVIDWDKAETRRPVDEIVRAFELSLRMRPDLCRAMLEGYRSIRAVSLDELDRSANNWDLAMIRDQWLFEEIYLRGNDRARRFLEPGGFVPFGDHWARLRAHLD